MGGDLDSGVEPMAAFINSPKLSEDFRNTGRLSRLAGPVKARDLHAKAGLLAPGTFRP
jgi:hypothetical protein